MAKTFPLKVTAAADSALELSTVTAPVHGTVGYDNESRQATYTPDIGFTAGADAFTYRAATGPGGLTATATVRIELLDERRSAARLVTMQTHARKPATGGGPPKSPAARFASPRRWTRTSSRK